MNLILKAIKSLLAKVENIADSAAAKAIEAMNALDAKLDKNNPEATGSFVVGAGCTATGEYAHAVGYYSRAIGDHSHAEGHHAEATGKNSHAEGFGSKARGSSSHAEGNLTYATGEFSHAEGSGSEARGSSSHAEGYGTDAIGIGSHSEGYQTAAYGQYQHVQGKFNIGDTEERYAHIVGNGSGTSDYDAVLSNAHTLDWEGNAWFAGTVEGTALILPSSTEGSTKRFRITVDDSGTLTATEVT